MWFYKEFCTCFVFLLVVGCGKGGVGGDSNSQSTSSTTVSKVGMKIVPTVPTGILYVQEDKSISTATGNGGLGGSPTAEDFLTPYSGIPLTITDANNNPLTVTDNQLSLNLDVTGDSGCKFNLDYSSLQIKIDASQIFSAPVLTQCHVQISGSATMQGVQTTAPSSTFDVILNPTFKVYLDKNDGFTKYWTNQHLNGQDNIDGIEKWINVTHVVTKGNAADNNFVQVNAITGAQSITSVDLSNTNIMDIKALQYLPNLQILNLSNTRISPTALA